MRGLPALSALVPLTLVPAATQAASRVQRHSAGLWAHWGLQLVAVLLCGQLVGCANRPPAPDTAVSGVALARERIRLPPDVVFEATLLDVTNPDLPPVVLGRQRRESAGNPPYAVWIPYPSVRFLAKGRYEVRAAVTLDGRLILASDKRYAVPQEAAFRHVDLWLERPPPQSATADAGVPLMLTHWRLVDIGDQHVPRPRDGSVVPFIVFQPAEGGVTRITGSGGCNRFLADYAMQGSRLRVGRLVSNITLCLQNGAMETRFFEALTAVVGFRQQDTQLQLMGADGETLLRFEAQEASLR